MKKCIIQFMTLIFCLCAACVLAEDTPPTQPPDPPSESTATPDPNSKYPFPTQIEGYIFVPFSGDEEFSLDSSYSTIVLGVVKRHFEEVYPGCRLSQLQDFIITDDNNWDITCALADALGSGIPYYHFTAMHFEHPLALDARFDVIVSYGYRCAFFTTAPFMAEYLEALDTVPISLEDTLSLAQETYLSQFAEHGLSAPDEEKQASLIVRVYLAIFHDSNPPVRLWSVQYYEQQAPYDHAIGGANLLFHMDLDADTGSVEYMNWHSQSMRTLFMESLGE